MRKTDKKLDNQLRLALTDVCETALKEVSGFQWLTHLVNYSNFPNSLQIVCVFETNDQLARFTQSNDKNILNSLIQNKLVGMGIKIKNFTNHILYDTEENCHKSHAGNWANRLN